MKATHMSLPAFALVTATVAGLAFGDLTVHDGETLLVGTIGSGPNNKNDGSVITLEAGATLKGTNSPTWSSWTIWRNLYATNGVACLDGSEMPYNPMITKHAILSNGLHVKGCTQINFQDNGDPDAADWFIRDLAGITFEGGKGTVWLANQGTLVSTPNDSNVTCRWDSGSTVGRRTVAIAGPNLRLTQVQSEPADFTSFDKVYLFDDGYIPEGHSVSAGGSLFRIHPAVVNLQTRKWESVAGSGTVTHPIALDGGTLELCAPLNASYAFAGKVSGSGTISIRRDLAPSLTSCSFAEIDGSFAIRTSVAGRTMDVTVAKFAPGSVLDDGGVANVTFPAEVAAQVRVFASTDGSVRYVRPDAVGRIPATVLPAASRRLSVRTICSDGTEIAGTPAAKVGAAAGARVTIVPEDGRTLNVVPGEGTVSVVAGLSDDQPLYWFDASKAYDRATFGQPYYTAPASANIAGKNFGNILMTNGFPYVESWNDWRGVTSGRFYLGRYYMGGENTFYPHSYPYLAVGAGPNGLNYLDFGIYNDKPISAGQPMTQADHEDTIASSASFTSKRRLEFTKGKTPEAVIMVFGSQKGGGIAVLGTGSAHAFKRSGRTLADAIVATAPANTSFHLDGVAVADPTAQTFNGGWQILSISGDAVKKVCAIGYDANYNDAGGQNYGEIIFFETAPSDGLRRAYERRLAAKWGIAGYADEPSASEVVRAEGRGGALELTADAGVELRGTFAGRVTLKGGSLSIAEPLPPTADDLPAEGRLHWFDADAEGALVTVSEKVGEVVAATNAVRGLIARGKAYSEVQPGETYLFGNGARAPFRVRGVRGLAAERTWIDFNHPANYPTQADDGNNFRFATFGEKRQVTNPAAAGVAQTFRTAFLAIDSSAGGGAPLLSDVSGAGGDFRTRDATSHEGALWAAGCSANVTGGVTRINGVRVDATERGTLTGEAETLSLVAAGNVSAAFIDSYGNSQSAGTPKHLVSNGLVFGELLLYTTALGDADVAKVEAYLRGKWTGTLPDGYSDLREATIDGTGTVSVAGAARLPRFAPTFAGSIAVGGESAAFAFGLDDAGRVTGAFATPEATCDLPADVTLTVNAAGTCPPGSYALFVCKGFVRPVNWTLDVRTTRRRVCALKTETADGVTRVLLNVSAPGLQVLVR